MAMDERLVEANRKLGEAYGTAKYDVEFLKYLEVFKVVAVERGEGVLGYEDPYDSIIESLYDGDSVEWIMDMLHGYSMMVNALRSVNYESLDWWEEHYDSCVKEVLMHIDEMG